ncbi:MAG: RNA polymerase Rpb4 family protein [Candidatus Micrarchaeota archaeon]|nr:RNA polymerase Rpb4 family protein [Candidatus Micrarchaeota archaeon]
MLGKEIKGSRVVPLSEVAAILEAREKDGELGFEQKNALTYAQKFAHLSKEKCHELIAKLSELPFVSDSMAVKLVDLLPKTEPEVMLIFQQEKRDITAAQCKQVLDILSAL